MSVLRHWLIRGLDAESGRTRVETDEATMRRSRDAGYHVNGPFVPESDLRGAVDALSDLLDALDNSGHLSSDPEWAAIVKARGELRRLRGGQ
jgi:hypothetical protein